MNTIKIFLASSCELAYERMIIGDKIRQADDKWRAKGVRLQLMVWEDYRPEFLGVRTQTEYDEYLVNESQIVIGLFKNRCGKYTQEEIVLAKRNNSENLHVFTLPADDGVNLVSDFLTKESIVAIKWVRQDEKSLNVSLRWKFLRKEWWRYYLTMLNVKGYFLVQ